MTHIAQIGRAAGWRLQALRAASLGLALAMGAALTLAAAAALTPLEAQASTFRVLSEADVTTYREIFSLQERGKMAAAKRLFSEVENDLLMGHVLHQRYLHPTAYRSSYRELKAWLDRYRDHPSASRIYRLAQKRRPSGTVAPKRPEPRPWRARPDSHGVDGTPPRRRGTAGRQARTIERRVISLIRRERPTQALGVLNTSDSRRRLTSHEHRYLQSRIAHSYFIENVDRKAFDLAAKVATADRARVPLADWTAGLAAWRLGDFASARTHFLAVAKGTGSDEIKAAGAFWAARASLRAGAPDAALRALHSAADRTDSFYGLLSARLLGRRLSLASTPPPVDEKAIGAVLRRSQVARAGALAQIGETGRAEDEFARAHGKASATDDAALLALATAWDLPSGQLLVGDYTASPSLAMARYPLPKLEPKGGFILDEALVFAFIRQESRFRPDAKSGVGARGIMQVMPRTAYQVTRDPALKGADADRLLEPAFNMQVGQKYIRELMTVYALEDNLFHLLVAYNGGPGNLRRWKAEMSYQDDPLLFIESIPSGETRSFVERVLTNFWMYRIRMGKATPSLDALAQGRWPGYEAATNIKTVAR